MNFLFFFFFFVSFDQALVRKVEQDVLDMLPTSVEVVSGDVGDPASLKAAVEGCNKIIYCATARSSITGDLNRVDNQGVYNVAKAFQVSFLYFGSFPRLFTVLPHRNACI